MTTFYICHPNRKLRWQDYKTTSGDFFSFVTVKVRLEQSCGHQSTFSKQSKIMYAYALHTKYENFYKNLEVSKLKIFSKLVHLKQYSPKNFKGG